MEKLFGIFDVKADAFIMVMVFNTKGQAIRSFSDMCCDSSTPLSRHPEDYKLLVLGDFSVGSGCVKPLDPPESLGFGVEYIPRKE